MMNDIVHFGTLLNFTQRLPLLEICPDGLPDEILAKYNEKANHPGDAGCDLYIPKTMTIPANARGFLIDHLISAKMSYSELVVHRDSPDDTFGDTAYFLVPRSSIAKTPLRMCNSIGIIDSSYRGHLLAAVDNLSDSPFNIDAGTRLFQVCAPGLFPIKMKIVSSLNSTDRGSGGFGSTGK